MALGTLLGNLGRNWGWIVLRGVVAILFGVTAFAYPGATLAVLVLVWGLYAILDGVFALVAGFQIKDEGKPMWPLLVLGLIGIAAGVGTFMYPGMTALVLLAIIAAWAIAIGLFQIIAAVRLRQVISNEWMLGLSGALSLAFGVFMLVRPGAGALSVIWILASYAVLFGIMLVALGFKLKGLSNRVAERFPKPA